MSSASKAWVVAASIGVVEALKDQGLCRQYSQAKRLSTPSSPAWSKKLRDDKLKQSEESLRKVMYLSCWGPN
ncbi:Protein of unknown function wound-induced - like 10 [Theobroma cacao]|nr:Protein of unknown function wound-induced - like 10 [Theobroma cacao]